MKNRGIYILLIFVISCAESQKPREFEAVTKEYLENEKRRKETEKNAENKTPPQEIEEVEIQPTPSLVSEENVLNCPPGFIEVKGNKELKSNDFCVMKYEAKNKNNVATSTPTGKPWVYISAENAQIKCQSIKIENYEGEFALISNPEWMTIARDLEIINENWSGGSVGEGHIFRGHTDNSPNHSLEVNNVHDSYTGTNNNKDQKAGHGGEQKRTYTLSNNSVIWDFAGNVSEWVDWDSSDSGFTLGPTDALKDGNICWIYKYRFPSLSGSLASHDLLPSYDNHDDTKSFGILYPGHQGATARGGAWPYGSFAGPFSMRLDAYKNYAFVDTGFRCVYRP